MRAEAGLRLSDRPDWVGAAQSLVDGCAALPEVDARVRLLEGVCAGLGDGLYPAFLRILALIGRFGDFAARAAVAEAMVEALRTGRLPSGPMAAWGHPRGTIGDGAVGRWSPIRRLGPVEFLCAWHAQPDTSGQISAPDARDFGAVATALLELVDAAPGSRTVYGELLLAVADDPIEGALSRTARAALCALATAWLAGAPSSEAASRFLGVLGRDDRETLGALARSRVW